MCSPAAHHDRLKNVLDCHCKPDACVMKLGTSAKDRPGFELFRTAGESPDSASQVTTVVAGMLESSCSE